MIDANVSRLRRLRGKALKVRAVARALLPSRSAADNALLSRGACAAWRLARGVSGRLRAHPYARYQRDAGFGVLFANSVVAQFSAFGSPNRARALKSFQTHLKLLCREVDDARSLAWAADLSDFLGRSQIELRSLTAAIENALYGVCGAGYMPRSASAATGHGPYLAL